MFRQIILSTFGVEAVSEYKFHPTRKWRFDYAIVEYMIAIEVEDIKGAA